MSNTKRCGRCKIEKPLTKFYRRQANKNEGVQAFCKSCVQIIGKERYWKTRKKRLEQQARWRKQHRQYGKEYSKKWAEEHPAWRKESQKSWRKKNPNYTNIYRREKYQSDLNYKLSCILRARQTAALKGKAKQGSAVKALGCTMDEAWNHIEQLFQPGMTRENHGKWEFDHIIPLSSFDLEDREQYLKAFHYTNLQPLWKSDNRSKGAKINV